MQLLKTQEWASVLTRLTNQAPLVEAHSRQFYNCECSDGTADKKQQRYQP